MRRRTFIQTLGAMGVAAMARADGNRPTILLRSGWQSVNIGDIAHTPGVLRLLRDRIPEAKLILWTHSLEYGAEEMLRAAFPQLDIVHGHASEAGKPNTPELTAAFEAADFLLHGSGPSLVARRELAAWQAGTGKPWGVYGVTMQEVPENLVELLNQADFFYCRETASVKNVRDAGVTAPVDFVPDGTFALDLRDDPAAERFLAEHQVTGDFICAVPRLRYTPYHLIRKVPWSDEEIARREAVNEEFKESDHAKMREAITAWVRHTGGTVCVVPEMTYQLDIGQPLVIDPLPDDVKSHVIRRETYWLPDEAASLYARAKAVISCECHSPIIAIANGTPTFYLRQATDTIKGQMYPDVGLGDWKFELDEVEGDTIAAALVAIADDPDAAAEKVAAAQRNVWARYDATLPVVRRSVGL